jgi:hypothetical protein
MEKMARKNAAQSPFDPLRRLLAHKDPLTWVFTGGAAALCGENRRHHSFMEHIASHLRRDKVRWADVVVNTCNVGQTLGEILQDLDRRILRFEPNLVALTVGYHDAIQGPRGRDAFTDDLDKIILAVRDADAALLLQTPHRMDLNDVSDRRDLRAYVRIIRDAARHYRVPCIDHWSYWKQAVERGLVEPADWLDEDRASPGAEGHRQMAHLLLRRLHLIVENAVDETTVEEVPKPSVVFRRTHC